MVTPVHSHPRQTRNQLEHLPLDKPSQNQKEIEFSMGRSPQRFRSLS